MTKTILILAANPKNTAQLRLDQEVREIDNGLERAQRRDEFILKQKWATCPIDVRRAMLDSRPNIVHFCGHGSGEEGIAFEDETGQSSLIKADTLADFFELFADRVECVVLNACYSEVQAEAISKHIPYVVGMRKAIGDAAAIQFSVAFYDALGAGESIEFAFKLACNAIQWSGIPYENLIPVMRSKNRPIEGVASQESIDWFTGMEFVWIPSGKFAMGQTEVDRKYLIQVFGERVGRKLCTTESPRHEVIIDGFWMGKYLVTQEHWQIVMENNPSWFNEEKLGKTSKNHPVELVSWPDVQDFISRLNEKTPKHLFRLPSEAEWEYACRAGTNTMFYFGDNFKKLGEYAWYAKNADRQTHPVGQLQPNAWGLYDMHGNVWEMCADIYSNDAYTRHERKNPLITDTGSKRVRRGGTWNHDADRCRSASRRSDPVNSRYGNRGFRLVRIPNPTK